MHADITADGAEPTGDQVLPWDEPVLEADAEEEEPGSSEDPIQLYLREIGQVSLLTAEQGWKISWPTAHWRGRN
jgi:hypothetical protein